MIGFTIKKVTPELAAKWLKSNFDNRPLTKSTVDSYARDMATGNWRLVHQPIAFDCRGNLTDGQHRLNAVVKSGATVEMYVASYSSQETAHSLPIDTQRRRTADFILGCSQRDQETARAIFRASAGSTDRVPTVFELDAILKTFGTLISEVTECMGTKKAPYRSLVSVRAAVTLRCLNMPQHQGSILEQYRSFVRLEETATLWPSVVALLRSFDFGGKSMTKDEIAQRSWLAFNPDRRDMQVIRLADPLKIAAEMREAGREHLSMFQFTVGTTSSGEK